MQYVPDGLPFQLMGVGGEFGYREGLHVLGWGKGYHSWGRV